MNNVLGLEPRSLEAAPKMTAILIILCSGLGQALRSLGQVKDLSLHGTYDKELRFRGGDGYLEVDVREGIIK